jgi:invasion protein IalB
MPKISLTELRRALVAALLLGPAAAAADPPGMGLREARFGDWRLACDGGACAIATEVAAADGSVVLTLGLDARDGALGLATPLPLFLPDGVALALGDAPLRALAWRTCRADVCRAEAPMGPELLAGLRRERSLEATLTLEDGVRMRLPVSLIGFSAALRALEAVRPIPGRRP